MGPNIGGLVIVGTVEANHFGQIGQTPIKPTAIKWIRKYYFK
jgi:hypothetical protein